MIIEGCDITKGLAEPGIFLVVVFKDAHVEAGHDIDNWVSTENGKQLPVVEWLCDIHAGFKGCRHFSFI